MEDVAPRLRARRMPLVRSRPQALLRRLPPPPRGSPRAPCRGRRKRSPHSLAPAGRARGFVTARPSRGPLRGRDPVRRGRTRAAGDLERHVPARRAAGLLRRAVDLQRHPEGLAPGESRPAGRRPLRLPRAARQGRLRARRLQRLAALGGVEPPRPGALRPRRPRGLARPGGGEGGVLPPLRRPADGGRNSRARSTRGRPTGTSSSRSAPSRPTATATTAPT